MSDLISRKALCEYALNQKDKSVTPNDIMRFPSAQPEKRTEERTETHACDCINRQDAIDYCYQLINVEHQQGSDEMNYGQERVNQTETILHHLELMSSAQPERTGRWIDRNDNVATCSVCGERWGLYRMLNFCPSCGADMRKDGETNG